MTRPYTVDLALRWSDMDAFGHVNNVAFVGLLQQARIVALLDWFAGTDVDMMDSGIVLVRQEAEYLAQLPYRTEPVHIDVWVQALSRSSFELGYELRDPDTIGDLVYLRAETNLVRFDPVAGRPLALTDQEREILGRYVGDPVPLRRRQAG